MASLAGQIDAADAADWYLFDLRQDEWLKKEKAIQLLIVKQDYGASRN